MRCSFDLSTALGSKVPLTLLSPNSASTLLHDGAQRFLLRHRPTDLPVGTGSCEADGLLRLLLIGAHRYALPRFRSSASMYIDSTQCDRDEYLRGVCCSTRVRGIPCASRAILCSAAECLCHSMAHDPPGAAHRTRTVALSGMDGQGRRADGAATPSERMCSNGSGSAARRSLTRLETALVALCARRHNETTQKVKGNEIRHKMQEKTVRVGC